jgi:threonine dehydratase
VTAQDVAVASERVQEVARRTPLEPSERLSSLAGVPVLLKREDLQVCRSYKVRGAFNLISSLTPEQQGLGVVCASAGNHGQGVAYSCNRLSIRGTVVIPANTPRQKRQRIAALGGDAIELVVAGSSYDEASRAARDLADRTGAIHVHPFDDARTIAGQGTVAVELLDQLDEVDTVVVPVGGGGLLAGVATWMRAARPEVRLIGVEPTGAAAMVAALAHGAPLDLASVDTFVDGAAVGRAGELTYPIVRELVDDVMTVPEGAVCTEMLELYQTEGIIAEPAGALASAALRQGLPHRPTGPVVCLVSGGNNDVSRYGEIVERSLLHEGLRHYFLVTFPQEPGSLRHFLDQVLAGGEDIVVFEYVKKNNRETGPALVGIELEDPHDLPALLDRMERSPLQIEQVAAGSPLFTFLM